MTSPPQRSATLNGEQDVAENGALVGFWVLTSTVGSQVSRILH